MFDALSGYYRRTRRVLSGLLGLPARLQRLQLQLARVELRLRQLEAPQSIEQAEMCVFSQWGEDGIIQWLIEQVGVRSRRFIEFGVENYLESNTRFLLLNNDWDGLVIDGDASNIRFVREDPISWRHNLTAVQAFVTAENINALLSGHGYGGDIGLLSIDIDGNDYWVWKAIDVVDADIVIVEYNARFGPHRRVTIPYDPAFQRTRAHYSGLYFGASLAALAALGKDKGYALVGCNTAGNNAFFVRRDRLPAHIAELSPEQAFRDGQFRQARDPDGRLNFQSAEQDRRQLAPLPLQEV